MPTQLDEVDGDWVAFVVGGAVWLAETRGDELCFRGFGAGGGHGQPFAIGQPAEGVAISETGRGLAVVAGERLHTAGMTAHGSIRSWTTHDAVEVRCGGLLAARDVPYEAGLELLVVQAQTTLAVIPQRLVAAARRVVHRSPARCAAASRGSFVVVGLDGKVIDGTSVAGMRDAWIDLDGARRGSVRILAGLRRDGSCTILHVERHDEDGILRRELSVDEDATRVAIARTLSHDATEWHVIVQVRQTLQRWSWDDLPAAASPRRASSAAARTTTLHKRTSSTRRGSAADERSDDSIDSEHFDVFLCYSARDRAEVKVIGERLKQRGIRPWLDEWEVPPGARWQPILEKQLALIQSAAVFVGSGRTRPWQQMEIEAVLDGFARRGRRQRGQRLIPVILASRAGKPRLPPFLALWQVVDMRVSDPDPIDQLVWGITGNRSRS